METWWIKSERIVLPDGVFPGAIFIEDGKIQAVKRGPEAVFAEGEKVDVGSQWIVPGFIDIHIHGSGGWSGDSADPKDVQGLADFLPSVGVTAFQPTVGGAFYDDMLLQLASIAQAIEAQSSGAKMIGIHMEGPFLNVKEKGVFLPEALLPPTVGVMQAFLDASKNKVQHVTLAPEMEGAEDVIRFLTQQKILVAGGHTDASYEKTMQGIEWGVKLSNHTCNAQRSIHHRDPGALGAYLLSDVYCELISDFIHVHPQMMEMIRRLKGVEKIVIVSDAILAAGIAPGHYSFVNHTIIIGEDGRSTLANGTLAGSTGDMLGSFQNWVKTMGVSVEETSVMASENPARMAGVLDRKGTIEVGKDADLLVLDSELSLVRTICEGRVAFENGETIDRTNPLFRKLTV